MIQFNTPIDNEGTEPEVTPPATPPTTPPPAVPADTPPETPPSEYGNMEDYLPEAAKFLYDKKYITHIPEGFNTEELDIESYGNLLTYNQEQTQKEAFGKGMESYQDNLNSKLSPLGKKILQYSVQNTNVSDEDIQGLIKEMQNKAYYSNLSVEDSPQEVVKAYYEGIGWDPDMVNQKLDNLISTSSLEKEAKLVKPGLDRIAEKQTQKREADDKAIRDFQTNLDNKLKTQISQQLQTGKLNGVDLDRETAEFLYNATMNQNVPVQLGKQTVNMGYAEALMRQQKYNGNTENVMLSLLVLKDGPKAIQKYFAQPLKNDVVEKHVREIKFSSKRRGTAKHTKPTSTGTGITF